MGRAGYARPSRRTYIKESFVTANERRGKFLRILIGTETLIVAGHRLVPSMAILMIARIPEPFALDYQ